jgi:UDPglucose 6-dehydrogenase
MKVGIIGKGFVGSAVYEGLGSVGNEMSFYDPAVEGSKFEDILDTDIVYLCVPTNPDPDGNCDVSIVESTCYNLHCNGYCGVVAIKSTVIPQTTDKMHERYPNLRLAFVPEFLRERSAFVDFVENNDVLAIGVYNAFDAMAVEKSHGRLPKNITIMSPLEAELVKYYNNVFNTAKIIFANGMYEVCKTVDADYQKIYDAICMRDHINPSYLKCSETMRGASGPCLSKDPLAFKNWVESLDMENKPKIFSTIVEDNNMYPKTVIKGTRTETEFFGKEINSKD